MLRCNGTRQHTVWRMLVRAAYGWWLAACGYTATGSAPGVLLVEPPGAERVVCARWCPTLPHPGGCSTIGAVRLSFRVRDGSGRFPVAVTTETTTWAVRQCSCDSVVRLPANTHAGGVWLVVGLGVDRIVDASRLAAVFPVTLTYRPSGGRVGGWGVLFVSAD